MNWKRITVIVTMVLLSAVAGYQVKARAQQAFPGPCTVVIPAEWGKYRGTSTGSGMVFEDKAGTLRIISQLPCSIDGHVGDGPRVLAEIHRK